MIFSVPFELPGEARLSAAYWPAPAQMGASPSVLSELHPSLSTEDPSPEFIPPETRDMRGKPNSQAQHGI